MPSKKKQTKAKQKAKPPPKKKATATTKPKPKPTPKMIIRRNAAPRSAPVEPESERTPITERLQDMGSTHVAASIGAGVAGNALGVLAVGQGWIGPKLTASLIMGGGVATTAAGYYWEADHMMAAGAGLTAAGTFSLVNQYAVDAYEATERRAQEKREKREFEKRRADARTLLPVDSTQTANRRLNILDGRTK